MGFVLSNDGINVCVFLFVKIVDIILMEIGIEGDVFVKVVDIMEDIIWFLFEKINVYCDFSRSYDFVEVYNIFLDKMIIKFFYDFLEELLFVDGVLKEGRSCI